MKKIKDVKYKSEFQLLLTFSDGASLVVDFKPYISGKLGAMLKDENYFKQVSIDSSGGLVWPNGFDFCPNYLYEIGKPISSDIEIAA